MPVSDIIVVFQWWSSLFLIGAATIPITKRLFSSWFDKGYLFSKAIGFAFVAYLVYVLGTAHILPFTKETIYMAIGFVFAVGLVLHNTDTFRSHDKDIARYKHFAVLFFVEEFVFFLLLLLWTWVKAHEPTIRDLEKFMDYGFMQSVLNSRYFPAPDMWWAGGVINYYYFGHIVTAVLTKLSGLPLPYTYNLMLTTIFSFTATMSFSIGYHLLSKRMHPQKKQRHTGISILGGILIAFFVTLAGNMQTIYAFTKGYTGEDVVPFWTILWSVTDFASHVQEGLQTYWYANATRFIPFTIHEFPSYSFVVSDVHGHVLSLPFVFVAIALLVVLFVDRNKQTMRDKHILDAFEWWVIGCFGFFLGILLMTNALDGPIYGGLFVACWGVLIWWPRRRHPHISWIQFVVPVCVVGVLAIATALPFLLYFDSFATGIGVNCPPAFLSGMKLGPFIFESVDKCQHSPLWMMWLLWGFFWFTGAVLFVTRFWHDERQEGSIIRRFFQVVFVYALVLIIFPEFFYVKDIYPAHFRSNTMFKLGYQAFIWWSIIAGYVIMHMAVLRTTQAYMKVCRIVFFVMLVPQVFLISIYPLFSVRSYFGELQTYKGIWGLTWFEQEYRDDWNALLFLNEKGAARGSDDAWTIVEGSGDSYTDANKFSAFSGIPTIAGWAVHEWLWRGSYDSVAPRQDDVRTIYESGDRDVISALVDHYHTRYIIVGQKERTLYPGLVETPFLELGTIVYRGPTITIYEMVR